MEKFHRFFEKQITQNLMHLADAYLVVMFAHIYPPATGQCQALAIERRNTFHSNDYFVIGEICTCLEVTNDSVFL